eukprot:CCRYP_002681-RA/>CCRYP_002681-RA protein AED:0.69 eAED:0.64 QI:0/0/0/0.5/1/1/2/0/329
MPTTRGISTTLSPREIVTQQEVDFGHHCPVLFCAYIQASEDAIITNTMQPRTHACVALGPSGYLQGSVKCINLEMGMVVKSGTVTKLPMPDSIIRQISYWGKKSKQAEFPDELQFLHRFKEIFDWDSDETKFDKALVEESAHLEIPVKFPVDTNTYALVRLPPEPDNVAISAATTSQDYRRGIMELDRAPHVTDDEHEDIGDDNIIEVLANDYPPHFDTSNDDEDVNGNGGRDGLHNDENEDLASDDKADEVKRYNGEDEASDSEDEDSQNRGEQEILGHWYPKHVDKCKEPTVIDYANKAYKINNGIIHLNPAVCENKLGPIYPELVK